MFESIRAVRSDITESLAETQRDVENMSTAVKAIEDQLKTNLQVLHCLHDRQKRLRVALDLLDALPRFVEGGYREDLWAAIADGSSHPCEECPYATCDGCPDQPPDLW